MRFQTMIYGLGFLGVLFVLLGVIMHFSCVTQYTCSLEAIRSFFYYAGHVSLLLAALVFCVSPFFKKRF